MLEQMNNIVRDYRATGSLSVPARPLTAEQSEAWAHTCLESIDRYVKADEGPYDEMLGKGQVKITHPGGPLSIPGVMTARFSGNEMEETQTTDYSVSTRLTRVTPERVDFLDIGGLPNLGQMTARAYHLDRLNPAASTVQEVFVPA